MYSDLDMVPRFPAPLQYLANPYIPRHQAEGEAHFSVIRVNTGISLLLSADMLEIMKQLSVLTVTIIRENEKRNLSNNTQFL